MNVSDDTIDQMRRLEARREAEAEAEAEAARAADTKVINAETHQFAVDAFVSLVEGICDDPSSMLHPWRDCEPPEEFARLRRIATSLGLDFDALVIKHGTPFEQERLRQVESGEIAPAPRESVPESIVERLSTK